MLKAELERENDILRHAELAADDTIIQLKARIELMEKYVDHQMQCQRRTIHRAYFTDKYPCQCGFDDLGIELVHTPIRTKSKKYML